MSSTLGNFRFLPMMGGVREAWRPLETGSCCAEMLQHWQLRGREAKRERLDLERVIAGREQSGVSRGDKIAPECATALETGTSHTATSPACRVRALLRRRAPATTNGEPHLLGDDHGRCSIAELSFPNHDPDVAFMFFFPPSTSMFVFRSGHFLTHSIARHSTPLPIQF